MPVITVWSEIYCPFAYLMMSRLVEAVESSDQRIEIQSRAWPLELKNEKPFPAETVAAEIPALAQYEPDAFARPSGDWPTTFLPAFEAVKWAYSLGTSEGVALDLAVRRAFFRDGANVSYRHVLLDVAEVQGLDRDGLAGALDSGRFRAAVMNDYAEAEKIGVKGSPTVILPDGASMVNPGMKIDWVRGLPIIVADDRLVYTELVRRALSGS